MHVNVHHSQLMYVVKGIHFNSYAIPDPYYPYPCQNNGTCDGVSGNATYVCPPEYKGRHMQVIYLMTVMRKHLSRNREVPVLIVTLD